MCIGHWEIDHNHKINHVLVNDSNRDYLSIHLNDVDWIPTEVYYLKPSVKKNEHIFAWYVQMVILGDVNVPIHNRTRDTDSGRIIELLETFLNAFNNLDIETCSSISSRCSEIDFSQFYLYKTQWLLEQLTGCVKIFRTVLINESIFNPLPVDCKSWWEQKFIMKDRLDKSRNLIDFDSFKNLSSLQEIIGVFENLITISSTWSGYHNKVELHHEIASASLFALANHWLRTKNIILTVLSIHRGLDLLMISLAIRNGWIIPTNSGLQYDESRNYVSFNETLKLLFRNNLISSDDKKFIAEVNEIRNHLREIHGFYVVDSQKAEKVMARLERFLQNLSRSSISKAWSMKEKFNFTPRLDLRIFFDIESGIGSYLSTAIDENFTAN